MNQKGGLSDISPPFHKLIKRGYIEKMRQIAKEGAPHEND